MSTKQLHRFSPIENEAALLQAAQFVIDELSALSKQLLDKELPLKSVKLFAHYPGEYEAIKTVLLRLGTPTFETHTSFYVLLDQPLEHKGNIVPLLGVRIADPYRSQVGCGDVAIPESYEAFEARHIHDDDPTNHVRHAVGHTLTMIELWHPNSEVLGYILSPQSDWIPKNHSRST